MAIRVGIDIGATKTKIILITGKGEILARRKIVTDSLGDPNPIVERSSAEVADMLKTEGVKNSKVEAIAVGIAGFSNPRTGMIDLSPNLKWHKVPFTSMMKKKLGREIFMANDVNAAAWGEFTYGAGQGTTDMVAVFVGSGIGGGIVSGKKLVEGATGTAGEVGHMTYRENGIKCPCGQRGCFEAYGGGVPMEIRTRKAVKSGKGRLILEMAKGDVDKINTRTIRLAAEKGDKTAGMIWKQAQESLVTLCSNLTSLLNPDRLVLGGGVLEGNPGLLKIIKDEVPKRAVTLSGRHVKVVPSQLGDDAVAMGAAALVDLYR